MSWNTIVIIICLLLAALTIYKECRRYNRAHLFWRITASLVAVAALAAIALPLSYTGDAVNDEHQAVLLTPGFNRDSLAGYPQAQVFTFDAAIKKEYPKAILSNPDRLSADTPAIGKLHVFGYGLNEAELSRLQNVPLSFHPSSAPGGISAISWNKQLKTGDQLRVQGSFINSGSKPVKLVLKGLNAGLDSVSIDPKTTKPFQLNTRPKQSGRAAYSLLAMSGADTLEHEQLPVEIVPLTPIKVLMLAASPDFENKFLKNWLSGKGYAVATRSAISKLKFSEEFVNMEKLPLDHVNPALLQKFDVLIGDLSILKALTAPEADALKQEVSQKGLGLIIREDSSGKAISWLQATFPVERSAVKVQVPVALNIRGSATKTAKINTDPVYLIPQDGTQPLLSDEQGHLLASSVQQGAGRLLFTTLGTTYNWMLAGDEDDYTTLWSLLISKAARKSTVGERWTLSSPIPTQNEGVEMMLQNAGFPSPIKINETSVAPIQNSLVPFEWTGTYWPAETGWQQAKQDKGQTNWWYTWPVNSWQNLRALKSLAATKTYINTATRQTVTKQIHQKQAVAVPKIYFYILFLVACSFLWAEAKFSL